ncbi:hypothetical protein R3P38DRAFT_3404640 [Favolaschia claudopus]|uniref:RING-CH-type domain-containing protein n=1 Tax=Favolaschia claudopus TaxID=2862362 RepID=A0AAW0ABI8_9AGAR
MEANTPTLDDLRVKSCFICLHEELAPDPSVAGRDKKSGTEWVHPCPKCALVAHDQCLIRWISSLPLKRHSKNRKRTGAGRPTIFVLDTFRCPHCRRPYELANPMPSPLHRLAMVFDALYMVFSSLVDLGCTAVGLGTLQTIPISFAIQARLMAVSGLFIHEVAFLESYLGPRMFNLLITSHPRDLLRSLFIVLPTIPFRLLLPGTLPKLIIPLYCSFPLILHGLSTLEGLPSPPLPSSFSPSPNPMTLTTPTTPMISTWPPSPTLIALLVPLLGPLYTRLRATLYTWILGAPPPPRTRRYLTQRAHALIRLAPPPPPPIPTDEDDPPPLVIADRIVQKDQASLTHDVIYTISALWLPRVFGDALVGLAGTSSYLTSFLGLRPAGVVAASRYWHPIPEWGRMGMKHRALGVARTVGGMLLGGSWVWADVDPVWWRYTLGYGIFILAKDALELYRLYLQHKEVRSRTVRNRDFAGVDVAELELVER